MVQEPMMMEKGLILTQGCLMVGQLLYIKQTYAALEEALSTYHLLPIGHTSVTGVVRAGRMSDPQRTGIYEIISVHGKPVYFDLNNKDAIKCATDVCIGKVIAYNGHHHVSSIGIETFEAMLKAAIVETQKDFPHAGIYIFAFDPK